MTALPLQVFAAALAIAMAAAASVTAIMPKKYAATARVLLPPHSELAPLASAAAARDISVSARGDSRMVVLRHLSTDPGAAAAVVNDFVSANAKKPAMVIDRASVSHSPVQPDIATNLLYGAAAGVLGAFGWLALRARRERPAPAPLERIDPTDTEAARTVPEAQPTQRELCERLLNDWFASHRMLALVSTGTREECANVAARLAVTFAELGAKTLVVDAQQGSSQNVEIKPAAGFAELYLLRAPRERLASVAAEAARRFRVVLIDASSAESREAFARLAGGALVVAQAGDASSVKELEDALARANATNLGTVI